MVDPDETQYAAIQQIEQTLRTVGLLDRGFAGETMLLDWSKSTCKDGPKVKLLLPDDESIAPFELATIRKGKTAGQRYYLFAIPLDEGLTHDQARSIVTNEESVQDGKKPYGKPASILYAKGFFNVPAVLHAIGDDDEFLEWIRQQPCAKTGAFDQYYDEATGETRQRCEPAHVRRVSEGAGVAIKPEYFAIPLIHEWHHRQTVHGEQVFVDDGEESAGRLWMEKKAQNYRYRWAGATLARALGFESLGCVPPTTLVGWADSVGVIKYVPHEYRGYADFEWQ